MADFIVYDDNGNILRTGSCPSDMVQLQGDNVIEGKADDSIHIIVDGKVVDKPIVAKTTDELLDEIRMQRDLLLLASDWTQLEDVPEVTKNRFKVYRQALRDLPSNYDTITDINDVVYPQLGE